jgi:hypothetical protein
MPHRASRDGAALHAPRSISKAPPDRAAFARLRYLRWVFKAQRALAGFTAEP